MFRCDLELCKAPKAPGAHGPRILKSRKRAYGPLPGGSRPPISIRGSWPPIGTYSIRKRAYGPLPIRFVSV